MYDLLRLLDTPAAQRRVSNLLETLSEVSKRFDENFLTPNSFGWGSQWKLEDGVYTLTLPVDEKATAKNVDVELDDDILKVKYEMETDASTTSYSMAVSVPEDADTETLDAVVKDGELTITVIQFEDEDTEEEGEDEDDTIVTIKRK